MNWVVRRSVVCGPPEIGFEVRLDGSDILPLVITEWAGLELGCETLILKVGHCFVT